MPRKVLRLKSEVQEDEKTPERDRCAEWIENQFEESERHEMPKTRIAELSKEELGEDKGWSRQHVSNVLDYYFREIEIEENTDQPSTERPNKFNINIEVPPECDWESYVRGYLNGIEESMLQ